MSGHRRAAAALHSLGDEDRQWILSALPADEQGTLVQYLDELKELGFDGDLSAASFLDTSGTGITPAIAFDRVRAASPGEIFTIFENEPSSLIGQFLSIQHWPWASRLQALFSPVRWESICLSISPTHNVAFARKAFLIDAVANRLRKPVRHASVEAGHQVFSSLLRWVKSWRP